MDKLPRCRQLKHQGPAVITTCIPSRNADNLTFMKRREKFFETSISVRSWVLFISLGRDRGHHRRLSFKPDGYRHGSNIVGPLRAIELESHSISRSSLAQPLTPSCGIWLAHWFLCHCCCHCCSGWGRLVVRQLKVACGNSAHSRVVMSLAGPLLFGDHLTPGRGGEWISGSRLT